MEALKLQSLSTEYVERSLIEEQEMGKELAQMVSFVIKNSLLRVKVQQTDGYVGFTVFVGKVANCRAQDLRKAVGSSIDVVELAHLQHDPFRATLLLLRGSFRMGHLVGLVMMQYVRRADLLQFLRSFPQQLVVI